MSNDPKKPRDVTTFLPPSADDAATANLNATGEFVVNQPGDDRTAVIPPATDDGTAVLQPPADDGTAVIQPAADDATAVLQPDADSSAGGGTSLFELQDNDNNGATGVYEPGGTQTPPRQPKLDRSQTFSDATGVFDPNDNRAGDDTGGATAVLGATDSNAAPASTERCGRYVLKHFHAKGGMGEIWMAEDPAIGRSVALKRMFGSRPDQQHRFRVEAQVTGQLEHPGIVPIHELGVNAEGQPFYTMKFVRGRTLQKVIDDFHQTKATGHDRDMEQFRLLQIFLSLCQTVAYAHSRGVLHRDLKPENVMLGSFGETLLLDWGIAKVMGKPEANAAPGEVEAEYVRLQEAGADTETRAGTIMGSLWFMSPEVASGKNSEVDQRSDVYLLGSILYCILTGRPPRQGKNAVELVRRAQREMPTAPRKLKPEVAKPLEAICLKAMAMQREDRYQTALALAEDVQRYAAGEPVAAYPEGLAERAWRWAKRHRTAISRSVAAVLLIGLLTFGFLQYREVVAKQAKAQLDSDRLNAEKQAGEALKDFRRLAEEARFFAANSDSVSENSPYFDPKEGEGRASAARQVAAAWGPNLDGLVLEGERDSARKDLYDLLLLQAQGKMQQASGAASAQETLALLAEAEPLQKPSRSFYRLRGQAHQQLGQDAEPDLRHVAADNTPTTALDHFLQAEQFRKEAAGKGENDGDRKGWQPDPAKMGKAIEEYRLALEQERNHFWSQFQLGRCYLALGKLPEAVEALGACVALRPNEPWGYSLRGLALSEQKLFPEAERDLNRAVELAPDLRVARLNRGVVYWQQKKTDQALADFAAVLEPPQEKRLIEAAFYRAQLYLQLGKVAEALADLDQVIEASPGIKDAYLHRARIYVAQGQNDRALTDLSSFLALTTGLAALDGWEGYGRRGHLLRNMYQELPQDKRDQPAGKALVTLALMELKRAVATTDDAHLSDQQGVALAGAPGWQIFAPRKTRVYDDLGAMLTHAGQVKEAIAAFSAGLALAPQDVRLLNKRGWLYDALKQRDKAQADFAIACRVEPDNAEAHSGLGYVSAVLKLPTEAQREADLALVHGSDRYLILHNVACIYSALSQAGGVQAPAHQDAAMALLHRTVQLWKRAGVPHNEIEEIKGDPAFVPLRNRRDFQALVRGE